jgi:superfamily II DNA or RNA helicase
MLTVGRRLTRDEDRKVRWSLTKRLYQYASGDMKELRLFEEDAAGVIVRVPRMYAIRNLGVVSQRSFAAVAFPSTNLRFSGSLLQSASRPQREAYAETLRKLQGCGGATLVLQPGSGKTVVALALAVALGQKTAVLCHKGFLLDQWRSRIGQFVSGEPKVGEIRQEVCTSEGSDFVLVSLQSLASRSSYPESSLRFGLVICDETHHMPSVTFTRALSKLSYRHSLGLTGTPRRSDGLGGLIYELVGHPSYVHRPPDNRSVQVNLVLYTPRVQRERFCRNKKLNMSGMISDLVSDPARNSLLLGVARRMHQLGGGRKGLLLSHRVSHLTHMYRELKGLGAELITGALDSTAAGGKRKKKGGDVQFSSWLTLSTYSMFSEGVDFNGDFLILASPKSDVEQSVGRILRGKNEGVRPVIIDIGDDWSCFKKQIAKRRRLYHKRGFQVLTVTFESLLAKMTA